jgi:hypothetical protein
LAESESEADPAALIAQFLDFAGNVVGRSAHFKAGADLHYTNLFTVVVGDTSKARKGSSFSRIRLLFESIDPDWVSNRIVSGLASGEGLGYAVRDPSKAKDKQSKDDPGVRDKRLMVFAAELAQVLMVMEREKNTLSAVLRDAFDTGNLQNLSKTQPSKATGAHISVVGHVTQHDLKRFLTDTAISNGFANRFKWVLSRRSKYLPDGGQTDQIEWVPLLDRLRRAIEFGKSAGEMKRDDEARQLWHDVYRDLSRGIPGLFGSVTSRAEAQTMRIACVYAFLDCSRVIRIEHLRAALEVWRYCEDSARYIFGESIGYPLADDIYQALLKASYGLTKSDIRNHFHRNRSAEELDRALATLEEYGLARCEREETDGKPATRWFARKSSGAGTAA